jgi:hypothetical protein
MMIAILVTFAAFQAIGFCFLLGAIRAASRADRALGESGETL